MQYCGPRGLEHATFKRWEPLSQALALQWQTREHEKCPGGHHPDTTDPEQGGDPDGMRLRSRLCRLCEISERSREMYDKNREPGEYQVWGHDDPDPPELPVPD